MPHYFFHLCFGDRVLPDEEGTEFRDRAAAREEASAVIRELSDPVLKGNPRRWAGWFLQVTDEGGPFFRAPIGHPSLEVVTKGWRPASKLPPAPQARAAQQLLQQQPSGRKVSAMVAQLLERMTEITVLTEHSSRLLGEISQTARKCEEVCAQAQILVARAQRVKWAADADYRAATKAPPVSPELSTLMIIASQSNKF